jgi:small conductance mechanosensitive channel
MPIGDLPNVVVMDYTESGISLRLLSRAKDQPTVFQMQRDLLYEIKKDFDKNGTELAYPRRQLIIKTSPETTLPSHARDADKSAD